VNGLRSRDYPYATLFRSARNRWVQTWHRNGPRVSTLRRYSRTPRLGAFLTNQIPQCGQAGIWIVLDSPVPRYEQERARLSPIGRDRKSTRLNSSHEWISY